MKRLKKDKKFYSDIAPDEIFLDAANLPKFNTNQFEGRIEKPIHTRTIILLSIFFIFGNLLS